MPNIRDHDASVYLKLQGDCLHVGGYEVDPVLIEGVCKFFIHWTIFNAVKLKNLSISCVST